MGDAYLGHRTQLSFGEETTPGTKADTSVSQFGLVNDVDIPDDEIDWLRFWNIGSGRDYNNAVEGRHTLASSLPFSLQSAMPLFYAFGKESCIGTDVAAGGGSTTNGATAVGATTVILDSVTDYAVNDYIQIDVTTNAEVRKITDITSLTITVDKAFRLVHLDGVACNEVTSPYTHTLAVADSLKSWTLEAAQLADTNFVRHVNGCQVDTLEIGCAEGEELKTTFGIKAMNPETSGTSASSVTPATTAPYMFDEGVVTLHGGAIARIKDFKLNMNNKLIEGRYIQSSNARYAYELVCGRRETEFTVTMVIDSKTIYDLLKTPGAATTFSGKFTRTASTDTIDIQGTAVRMKSVPHPFPEEGRMEVQASYIAKTCVVVVEDTTPYYWAV